MVFRALIDTNVLIDYIAEREPFFQDAYRIVNAAEKGLFYGCIAAHSVPDIFYILRKSIPDAERREVLRRFCDIFEVVGINRKRLIDALADESFVDFEDCLQSHCAEAFRADYIVTRNPKDFTLSAVPTITPAAFNRHFDDSPTDGQEAE